MAPLKPTGFWSYTSADDAASDGRLSRLRTQLANRLRQQIGRPVHLFQDVAAIPPGTLWEQQIESALAESSFFIPILTPGFLQSEWCVREVRRFREHMGARGRDDLILPVHYLDVTGFSTVRRGDCVDPDALDYLRSLQWVDFRKLEPQDSDTAEVRVWLATFARRIEEALYREVPPRAEPKRAPTEPEPPPELRATPLPLAGRPGLRKDPPPPGGRLGPAPAWKKPVLWGATGIATLFIAIVAVERVLAPAATPAPDTPAKPVPDSVALDNFRSVPSVPAASSPPRASPVTCPANDVCPEMVLIPHGSFQMGTTDEELDREKVPQGIRAREMPRHPVTIGADFYLGKYAVTLGEFKAFVGATGPRPAGGCYNYEKGSDGKFGWQLKQDRTWDHPGFPQTDRDPVVCVSYDDAVAYAGWLNAVTGTNAYRLPGEAEWEYAARANTTTSRFWGDGREAACRFANVSDLSLAKQDGIATPDPEQYFNCSDGFVFTAPAGSFLSNDFGLYDMLGNVWQWTADYWNDDQKDAPANGMPRTTGDSGRRVVRGGSWDDIPMFVRAGNRLWGATGSRFTETGFRVAKTL